MGADLEAQLPTFRLKKGKERGKVVPFTFVMVTVPSGKDLSHLPPSPPYIMLRVTLYDIPLATDTRLPLSLRRSLRHWTMERSVLVDKEKDAEENGARELEP